MKTKIFIDFDGTLFDSVKFKEKLFSLFSKYGFSRDEIQRSYNEELLDFRYSPVNNVIRLSKIKKFDLDKAFLELEQLYKEVPECLYRDSDNFLSDIDRSEYEICLLTLGDSEFQGKKFYYSGLQRWFDKIYICENQKWDYLQSIVSDEEKFYLIDDRGDTTEKVGRRFKHSRPIRIARYDMMHDFNTPSNNFKGIEVKNLIEAAEYL